MYFPSSAAGMTVTTSFFEECETSPRMTNLANFFSSTAAGRANRPIKKIEADRRLLVADEPMGQVIDLLAKKGGPFDQHYHGSIPYRLEDDCRLGYAILQYAKKKAESLNLYTLGSAEGTIARILAELANGRIDSLACSPSVENLEAFLAHGDPPNATFFARPFHHLTKDMMSSRDDLRKFTAGFDIILEDTTFQMFSANRLAQIQFVSQHLKENGLFLFLEKCRHPDEDEYLRRELQKDYGYKTRYFSREAVLAKGKEVLKTMKTNEVTLEDLAKSIRPYFCHCHLIWNSGNFYMLLASNSLPNINLFMSGLLEPAIPKEYVYNTIPQSLFDDNDSKVRPPL